MENQDQNLVNFDTLAKLVGRSESKVRQALAAYSDRQSPAGYMEPIYQGRQVFYRAAWADVLRFWIDSPIREKIKVPA